MKKSKVLLIVGIILIALQIISFIGISQQAEYQLQKQNNKFDFRPYNEQMLEKQLRKEAARTSSFSYMIGQSMFMIAGFTCLIFYYKNLNKKTAPTTEVIAQEKIAESAPPQKDIQLPNNSDDNDIYF